VIVWSGQDSNQGGIRGNAFDASDVPVLAQEAVINGTTAGDQLRPAVAGTPAGFVVAWEHTPIGGNLEIKTRTFTSLGTAGQEQSAIQSSSSVTSADVEADAGGNFVVVWAQGVAPANSDIFGRRFDSGGSPVGTEFLVNVYTTSQQLGPRVDVEAGGDFVVTWNAGSSNAIPQFQRFDSAGNKVAPTVEQDAAEWPVSETRPGSTDVALADDRSFATVYVDASGVNGLLFDDSGCRVDSNLADAASDEFIVHRSTPTDQTGAFAPWIATDGNGRYVAVYGNTGRSAGPLPHVKPHVAARLFTSGFPSVPPSCADANGSGTPTTSDALYALQTAVGTGGCILCLCDIDDSGAITASDALANLRAAVGIIVTFSCPSCPTCP
jgi:hypothetical protein